MLHMRVQCLEHRESLFGEPCVHEVIVACPGAAGGVTAIAEKIKAAAAHVFSAHAVYTSETPQQPIQRAVYDPLVARPGASGGATAIAESIERLLRVPSQQMLYTRVQCLEHLGGLFRSTLDVPARYTDLQVTKHDCL
jgi:hypothetical protein